MKVEQLSHRCGICVCCAGVLLPVWDFWCINYTTNKTKSNNSSSSGSSSHRSGRIVVVVVVVVEVIRHSGRQLSLMHCCSPYLFPLAVNTLMDFDDHTEVFVSKCSQMLLWSSNASKNLSQPVLHGSAAGFLTRICDFEK